MKKITDNDYTLQGFLASKLPNILFILSAVFFLLVIITIFNSDHRQREIATAHQQGHNSELNAQTKHDAVVKSNTRDAPHTSVDEKSHSKVAAKKGLVLTVSPYTLKKFFHSYLVAYIFYLSITLGAMFFVLIQFLTSSYWSVVVRRIAEHFMSNAWLMAILFVPILLGMEYLYHWTNIGTVKADPILTHKYPYLNVYFFVIRIIIYFTTWMIVAHYYSRTSLKQDSSSNTKLTLNMQKKSTWTMVVYAITLTFFSIDVLMSLTPHWYSTMYGVYYFSTSTLGALVFITLIALLLRSNGYLKNFITRHHYHDLGKLIFTFVVFWAYIAFSQYFLIWYANIPEETIFFINRLNGSWKNVSILLIVGQFFVPFLLLLSRNVKRNLIFLSVLCVWLAVMHYIDIYWLISPALDIDKAYFNFIDLNSFLFITCIYFAFYFRSLRAHPLIPKGDPRLERSISFTNI